MTTMIEKTVPYDIDAENAVIASLLIDSEAIYQVYNIIIPQDFFNENNRNIYQACVDLYKRGDAVNQITVFKELINMGVAEEMGGASYLSRIISEMPSSLHVESYANVVKRCAVQRIAINFGHNVQIVGYNETDIDKLVNRVGKGYMDLQSSVAMPALLTPQMWADRLMNRYDILHRHERDIAMSFGFYTLDRDTGGIYPGEYWILAGYAGIGKSTIADQIAESIAITRNVLMVSIEMSEEDIGDRRIASKVGQKLQVIRKGNYSDDLYQEIYDKVATIADSNIFYFGPSEKSDLSGVTTDMIYSMAQYVKLSYGLGAIIVDYLQNLDDSFGHNSYERTTYISRRLQHIARSMKVPIICLCQLNRKLTERADKIPTVSDLRDSGAIEQDADGIILIHRDSHYEHLQDDEYMTKGSKPKMNPDEAVLIVAKHRQGDKQNYEVDIKWDKATRRYIDPTPRPSYED